jgi:GxxExxY protein
MLERGIPFHREVSLPVCYKGQVLSCGYRADFICFDSIIIELKAVESMGKIEMPQVLNHLKATGHARALLLNFGAPVLDFKRIISRYLEPLSTQQPPINE